MKNSEPELVWVGLKHDQFSAVYRATSLAAAWQFTDKVDFTGNNIEVETPHEGTWKFGGNFDLRLKNLLPWQSDTSLANGTGKVITKPSSTTRLFYEFGRDADNVMVKVQCGCCHNVWPDGIMLNRETVVLCPSCKRYIKVIERRRRLLPEFKLDEKALLIKLDGNRIFESYDYYVPDLDFISWRIFWKNIKPSMLKDAKIYSGYTYSTYSMEERVFLIAVQSNEKVYKLIKQSLKRDKEFTRIAARNNFILGVEHQDHPILWTCTIEKNGSIKWPKKSIDSHNADGRLIYAAWHGLGDIEAKGKIRKIRDDVKLLYQELKS